MRGSTHWNHKPASRTLSEVGATAADRSCVRLARQSAVTALLVQPLNDTSQEHRFSRIIGSDDYTRATSQFLALFLLPCC